MGSARVDVTFDIELNDGRVAHCWQACNQEYGNNHCIFSAGLVEGIEPDTLYFRLEKDGEEGVTLFLRPDEMMAMAWVCNGALWSSAVLEEDENAVS